MGQAGVMPDVVVMCKALADFERLSVARVEDDRPGAHVVNIARLNAVVYPAPDDDGVAVDVTHGKRMSVAGMSYPGGPQLVQTSIVRPKSSASAALAIVFDDEILLPSVSAEVGAVPRK